nr:hypothetical protein BaRGS_001819 [Batillaria attramentaria]
MYKFDNEGEVETAVNELAAASNDGELFVVVDEAFRGYQTPLPGHTGDCPEKCERCADDIADLMQELRVGQLGQDLQYWDTIILCDTPRDDLPVVSRFRARGLPVEVVTSDGDEAAIRDVALAVRDVVTVTDWKVMTGLERAVVVGVESGKL